ITKEMTPCDLENKKCLYGDFFLLNAYFLLAQLSLLTTRVKALQLQKTKHDLEMVLSIIQSKNEQLEEDLKRALQQLQNKMLKVKSYKEGLLNALGEFLGEHFPIPEKGGITKKKIKVYLFCSFLNLILLVFQILIQKLMSTPHDPYVTINDSFWPPYIELLLRYGIALRHPEDPNRMRLEAFHM
uniref:Centromere protein K n=1 Tax=Buteo japonicus TaxID=224669 RepID=A0A8C0AXE5_9AVES